MPPPCQSFQKACTRLIALVSDPRSDATCIELATIAVAVVAVYSRHWDEGPCGDDGDGYAYNNVALNVWREPLV